MNESMMDFVGAWLADRESQMVAMLASLVDQESPSSEPELVKKVGLKLVDELAYYDVKAHWLDDPASGVVANIGNPQIAPICLTGHMDTVFAKGTTQTRPFTQSSGNGYGPGVADMKAGIVMNCYILAAFRAWELHSGQQLPFQIRLVATIDEEIGSPTGRILLRDQVQHAKAVFNAEPGRISGNVVTARKGGDTFIINVHGRAAHAGVSHQDGASAIVALAKIITAVSDLTDYEQGITTNIGIIEGGTTSNTVAESAMAKLDVRYLNAEQRAQLVAELELCVHAHGVAGVQAELSHVVGFLPFESKMSGSLLACYQQQARRLGETIEGEFTGGCSDAGLTSSMGIPTLCATGPIGEKMHTAGERCDLTSMVKRAQIVAYCCAALD